MVPRIGRTLGGFYHMVSLQMVGVRTRWETTGRWVYPHLDVKTTSVGLEEVKKLFLCCYNTIAQYIVTSLILEICMASERRSG